VAPITAALQPDVEARLRDEGFTDAHLVPVAEAFAVVDCSELSWSQIIEFARWIVAEAEAKR
jgi:hypothetical protein